MINTSFFKAFRQSFSIILTLCVLMSSWNLFAGPVDDSTKWVGTWGTAPQLVEPGNIPPSPGLTDNSLRQVVRVSIGGDSLRVKFSNKYSTDSVTMKSVQIAVSNGGSSIVDSTNIELTFNGSPQVTMDSAAEVTSDPFYFKLEPRMTLAITIYFGHTSADVTGHPGSRTTSYLITGNDTAVTDFTSSVKTDHWYVIMGIDVKAPLNSSAIAVLGNSITDGRGSTTNLQNRWTDMFSEFLLKNESTQQVSVLNMGLGGNCVLTGGLGPTGINRFEHDVLNQTGVRSAIIFEGVNDIGSVKTADASTTIANNLISAYKQMIKDAHDRNIWIYGATILPFKGNANYSNTYSEKCRNKVNNWIRNSGYFDGVIDFDKALRNPSDTASLGVPSFQGDYLHPDTSGFRKMAKSIDLKLFEGLDSLYPSIDTSGIESFWIEPECAVVGDNWNITNDILVSNGSYVSVKSGLNSTSAAPDDSASSIYINFAVTQDTTYYLYALLNCVTSEDDSYWVKMDTGNFSLVEGLNTSGWQWQILDSFAITTGNHTLTFAYCEDGALLDKIYLSNLKVTPTGIGKAADKVCLYVPPVVGLENYETIEGYALGQNFPNPLNNKTTIAFEIPKDTFVSLKIFNMSGIEIAELAGKDYSQGKHTVDFDAHDLPKGTYLYTLKAENYSLNQKMVLLGK